jgi:aspartate racemase
VSTQNTSRFQIVGVLGGMGPDATVDFMSKVIALTPADEDQDHIHMLVDHNPKVPNRQAAILGDGEDPAPTLIAMAQRLETAGADFLVIPCNTAYVFGASVAAAVSIPLLSIIDVTVDAIAARDTSISAVGVLATDGCLQAGVYQEALQGKSMRAVLPDDDETASFMTLVGKIKAGNKSEAVAARMRELCNALIDRGAQAVIAGCTEIPLVLDDTMLSVPLISSTDVLAQETVRLALSGEDHVAG